jgi:hypothetical protein
MGNPVPLEYGPYSISLQCGSFDALCGFLAPLPLDRARTALVCLARGAAVGLPVELKLVVVVTAFPEDGHMPMLRRYSLTEYSV